MFEALIQDFNHHFPRAHEKSSEKRKSAERRPLDRLDLHRVNWDGRMTWLIIDYENLLSCPGTARSLVVAST